MSEYNILASNIKKYRSRSSLTQKELAEKIHKKEITVRKYESGNVKIPFDSLLDICRAFTIQPSELFECDNGEISEELIALYPEFDNDTDKFNFDPNSYDFINKIKKGNGDTESLLSSVVSFFALKNNIDITLDNFNVHEEILLFNLLDSTVSTFLNHIKFKNSKSQDNE